MRRNVETVIPTTGTGIWSTRITSVKVVALDFIGHDADHGTLNVYFDPSSWDVEKDDLIYTDPGFRTGVRDLLSILGINVQVDYNEQGMQGADYVSFDAWGDFNSFAVKPEVSVITDYKVEKVLLAADVD